MNFNSSVHITDFIGKFSKAILNIGRSVSFNDLALEIFRWQAINNPVYKEYLELINCNPVNISAIENIPFLPITFFKNRKVLCNNLRYEKIFLSSGTVNSQKSTHYIFDLQQYRSNCLKIFEKNLGPVNNYHIFALLPSFNDAPNSSLAYMLQTLIEAGGRSESGFYLGKTDHLYSLLMEKKNSDIPVILFGLSYALMDFAEQFSISLPGSIIIETGGMKGNRREMIREELHKALKYSFKASTIASEYGMCELMSQAYSLGNGLFTPPPWMKVLIRKFREPFQLEKQGNYGCINIIDLANIHSCAFISTQDVGMLERNGTFRVLGRFDQSELRGCNLMMG